MHDIYEMRGARVEALSSKRISSIALETAELLKINKHTSKNMGIFMESLLEHGILVDVVDDNEWLRITNAGCINSTILIPNGLYDQVCKGYPDAVFIFFHELGHLLLGHKAMLHHSDILPNKSEDSEWQADEFSKNMLEVMKMKYIPEQLSFRF